MLVPLHTGISPKTAPVLFTLKSVMGSRGRAGSNVIEAREEVSPGASVTVYEIAPNAKSTPGGGVGADGVIATLLSVWDGGTVMTILLPSGKTIGSGCSGTAKNCCTTSALVTCISAESGTKL
jgi:hypothetical protein